MTKNIALILSTLLLFLTGAGCSSTAQTSVNVSGLPGIPFTAKYRVGVQTGQVSTMTQPDKPVTVLGMFGSNLDCDIKKQMQGGSLTVEIMRGKELVATGEIPADKNGMKVWNQGGEWRTLVY